MRELEDKVRAQLAECLELREKIVTVSVRFQTPGVPNYLRLADLHGRTDCTLVNIGDLSDEDLRRVAAQWTEALLENARKQRA